jgi:hypothetical protein
MVNSWVPKGSPIRTVLNVFIAVLFVFWFLAALGFIGAEPPFRIGR